MELSHINASGEANMVDVGDKQLTERSATASGIVRMLPSTLQAIKNDGLKKGEVLAIRSRRDAKNLTSIVTIFATHRFSRLASHPNQPPQLSFLCPRPCTYRKR